MEPFLIFGLVVLVIGALVAWAAWMARVRRQELAAVAGQLGLRFRPANDYSVGGRYAFLNKLCQGSNRYAFNLLEGKVDGHEVTVFDYHYETYSTDSKGHRQTHHHYFSFLILKLPKVFPEVIIGREGLLSKVAQAFGYDNIDFESAEFSRNFCVRSPDRRFAYDICHPRVMEYLLENRDLNIEIEEDCMSLFFASRLKPAEIGRNLRRLIALREFIPDYLWNRDP